MERKISKKGREEKVILFMEGREKSGKRKKKKWRRGGRKRNGRNNGMKERWYWTQRS